MNISEVKQKLDIKRLKNFASWLLSKTGWFLVMISFLLLLYCGYLWYAYIFNPHWSAEKRQQYLDSKGKEVIFNQNRFEAVVAKAESRSEEYQKQIKDMPDIFRLNK